MEHECSICLGQIHEQDKYTTPCQPVEHYFHQECFQQWTETCPYPYQLRVRCPLCRQQVLAPLTRNLVQPHNSQSENGSIYYVNLDDWEGSELRRQLFEMSACRMPESRESFSRELHILVTRTSWSLIGNIPDCWACDVGMMRRIMNTKRSPNGRYVAVHAISPDAD